MSEKAEAEPASAFDTERLEAAFTAALGEACVTGPAATGPGATGPAAYASAGPAGPDTTGPASAGPAGTEPGPLPVRVGADAAGTPVIDVPAAGWVAAAAHARDELGMDFLDWLSAVDEPEGDPAGLDVVLHVAATSSFGSPDRTVRRLLLRTRVPDADLNLPSLTGLWPGVAWHERETFEMFGLTFTGFDDGTPSGLRPLLLPDGFEGTPLRKSFVLAARAAKAWPGAKDPGDSGGSGSGGRAPARRKTLPPGVPDPSWGPHVPGTPRELPAAARPLRDRPARVPREGAPARPPRAPRGPASPGTGTSAAPGSTGPTSSTAPESSAPASAGSAPSTAPASSTIASSGSPASPKPPPAGPASSTTKAAPASPEIPAPPNTPTPEAGPASPGNPAPPNTTTDESGSGA